jgi:serine/threonine protein kinase
LKPENIMITTDGKVKLIDFGLAATEDHPCERGTIVGSPQYIAPEILNNEGYDRRVDLFSLGSVLYTISYSILPFIGRNDEERLLKNAACVYEFPENECKTLLEDFIRQLMTRNPDERLTIAKAQQHPWLGGRQKKINSIRQQESSIAI